MTYIRRNIVPLLVAFVALAVALASMGVIADRVRERRGGWHEGGWGRDAHHDHARWMSDAHSDMQHGDMRDGMHSGMPGRQDGGTQPGPAQPGGARGPLLGVTVEAARDGVRIASIEPGSAAASAGVQPGDVLAQVDGHDVRSAADVRAALASAGGDSVRLTVRRDGKEQQLTANLGGDTTAAPRARRGGMPAPMQPAQPMQPGQPGQTPPGAQPFGGFTLGPELQQVLQQLAQRLLPLLLEAFRSQNFGGQNFGGGALPGLTPAPGGRSAPAVPAPATPAAPGGTVYWGTVRTLDARSITLDGALGPVTLQITPQTAVAGAVAPHVGGTATVIAAGGVAHTIAVIN